MSELKGRRIRTIFPPAAEQREQDRPKMTYWFPDKQPLSPEIIARLGPERKGIVAGFGALKDTGIFPEDSLEYQLEVRAEWN